MAVTDDDGQGRSEADSGVDDLDAVHWGSFDGDSCSSHDPFLFKNPLIRN